MKYPKKLEKGATIGVIAPSSAVSSERVAGSRRALEEMGFQVRLADNLDQPKGGYLAGEADVRAAWINKMFADPKIDAIICIRGGDGSNQLVGKLDLDLVRKNPKIFVGYSDITTFHLLFNQQCDLVTFHGPMASSNMIDHFDPETRDSFFAALNADETYTYPAPNGFAPGIVRAGKAEGRLTGGNLTLICSSIGTPGEIDTAGKILFIEEIGAHIGGIDRDIYQLKNAGKLDHVAGILLGQFTNCRVDEPENYSISQMVAEATAEIGMPIMDNIQSGHEFPMITLPLGAPCTMDTADRSIRFAVER